MDDAQRGADGDSRVERVAATGENLNAGLARQRMRAGDGPALRAYSGRQYNAPREYEREQDEGRVSRIELHHRDKVREIYDERFCRMWDFYLAGSETAFRYDGQVNFQIQLSKRQDAVPLTRDYIAAWETAHAGGTTADPIG